MFNTFQTLASWQKEHGRHHLPWQGADAYGVWVSELMLQQTQVSTVLRYYDPWMKAFPSPLALSKAEEDQVLGFWRGLGYYRRARYLHAGAKHLVQNFQGKLPSTLQALQTIPGVGRSTAGAILSLGLGLRGVILEGNTKRVLARLQALKEAEDKPLWHLAESLVPQKVNPSLMACYTQGMMDLGTLICTKTKPACQNCPLQSACQAHLTHPKEEALFGPKPAKPKVSSLQLSWFLVFSPDQVLLQKVPTQGIWGGLWAPLNELSENDQTLIQSKGDSPLGHWNQSNLTHQLTHRRLSISLNETTLSKPSARLAKQTGGTWHLASALGTLGLPRPLERILQAKGWL